MTRLLAMALTLLGVLAGCATDDTPPSSPSASPGPPAEPGEAPPVRSALPGRVVELPSGSPEGAALDPATGTLALALREPARLALLDTSSRRVRTVPSPGAARHLSIARPGELLVAGESTGTLARVRLPAGEVVERVSVGRGPHDGARVGNRVFVANEFGSSVGVVEDGRMVRELTGLRQPGGLTATDERVAVVDVWRNRLHVFDARTLERVATLPAGRGPSHVRPIGPGRVAVADTRGNALLSYGVAERSRRLDRVALGGRAYGLATEPRRGFAYVTLANTNEVARVRVSAEGKLHRAGTVDTVAQPNAIAVDERSGTVYVVGRKESEVQILPRSAFSR